MRATLIGVRPAAAYRCIWRPRMSVHGHPALFFDAEGRLDVPVISFVREAQRRLSANSVRVYVYALLPFLTESGSRPELTAPIGLPRDGPGDPRLQRRARPRGCPRRP